MRLRLSRVPGTLLAHRVTHGSGYEGSGVGLFTARRGRRIVPPAAGIREVAARADVSVGTVSNVLNKPEVVAPATRQRVQRAIAELGFVRNESARHLRAGRGRSLGLVVLDVANPFFTDVARGAEDAANSAGYVVILCNSDESPDKEARYLNVLEEQRVQGILITPVSGDSPQIAHLRKRGTAVVLLDRTSSGSDQCSVAVNDVAGGRLAAAHLLALGHEGIAYVTGPLSLRQCADRREGAQQALAEAGQDPHSGIVDIVMPALNAREGASAVAELLAIRPRPTAVFCANDLLALGVLRGLAGTGLSVPKDLSVAGYDDIEFASASAVPLTSVRQPTYQLGRTAAELLLEESDSPGDHAHQQIVFQPKLVVRESTSRPPARRLLSSVSPAGG